jgi:hypothetical protein
MEDVNMDEEQKSFPVKYMPVQVASNYDWYDIVDTTLDKGDMLVCSAYSQEMAYKITKFLNESEGYVYRP